MGNQAVLGALDEAAVFGVGGVGGGWIEGDGEPGGGADGDVLEEVHGGEVGDEVAGEELGVVVGGVVGLGLKDDLDCELVGVVAGDEGSSVCGDDYGGELAGVRFY